jgi:uncharacterized protein (TIGR02996 family)
MEPRPMLEDVEEAVYQAEDEATPLDESEQELLSQLERALASREGAVQPDQDLAASLLDAVVAELDRDEPRLVYADWLCEREDPRGELIRLDMALKAGKKVKRKRDALLKSEQEALLGPLAKIVRDPVFERGLLDEVQVALDQHWPDPLPPALRAALLDTRWRTVRRLVCFHDLSPVLRHAPLDSLDILLSPPVSSLLAATERPSPLPLREATLSISEDEHALYDRLGAVAPWVPRLQDLALSGWNPQLPEPPASFFRSPLARQLKRLSVETGALYRVDRWPRLLVEAESVVSVVRLTGVGSALELERAPDGRYRLRLHLHAVDAHDQRDFAELFRLLSVEHVADFEILSSEVKPARALTDAVRHLQHT